MFINSVMAIELILFSSIQLIFETSLVVFGSKKGYFVLDIVLLSDYFFIFFFFKKKKILTSNRAVQSLA